MSFPLYPLQFTPIIERAIWGGRKLGSLPGKSIGPESDYAESWEISDLEPNISRVSEGPLAGTSLRELMRAEPEALLGSQARNHSIFPLLVKFLDAQHDLSVQVHPDDDLARQLGFDRGKSEMWVILDSERESLMHVGLREGVDREALDSALKSRAVECVLHGFHPRPGDCVYLPAGTVHAIGAGILLAEVQQPSLATFRLFDWNRMNPDGEPRELHQLNALLATDFNRGPVDPIRARANPLPNGTLERLVRSPFFSVDRYVLNGTATVGRSGEFTVLVGLQGSAEIEWQGESRLFSVGQTMLLPAAIGPCRIHPISCPFSFLHCSHPKEFPALRRIGQKRLSTVGTRGRSNDRD